MIIAADATTFARKVEEKIDTLLKQREFVTTTGAGLGDFAAYQFEVGLIKGLREAKDMMTEAAKELSDPQSQRNAA